MRSGAAGRLLRAVVLVLLAAAPVVVVPGPASAAPFLPPGFAVQTLPSGQGELLTDFDVAPDGSTFTTGKNGRVAWVSADGQARTLADVPVVTVGDLGLSGIAVAPDFDTSRTVYLARTHALAGRWTMRLSAHRVAYTTTGTPEPASLTEERVLWDLPIQSDAHSITGVVAADDGTLWVTVGDAADFRFVDPLALRALDLDTGYGKLLHVTSDGRGVTTNPYYDAADPSSWRSRVYASGFRSPFRLSLDPGSGMPVLGDVGWGTWEEVNLVRPGASYGWPCWEGNTRTPAYRDMAACEGVGTSAPLWAYEHGPLGTSVTGGVVYTGSSYPEEYRGAYFFGDYTSQRVYTLRYDAQGLLVREPEAGGFGVENGAPVSFAPHPENGDVMWADIGSSTIKRLVYGPGNRPPTAVATFGNDPATRTVSFDARDSTDLDGHALTYDWAFGDGGTAAGPTTSHTYAPGTGPVQVRLTVSDALGSTGSTTFSVVPGNAAPTLTLTPPAVDARFAVGEPVTATATATDAEEGDIGARMTWSVVQLHCSGGYCHDHPGTTTTGPAYAAPFVDHGDSTSLRITASVTDAAGMTAREVFEVLPRTRRLGIAGNTPSAITVNGVARASSEVTVGARVSVIAPTVATDGVATFEGWNDGEPRERSLVMGDADLDLTATYLTPIERRYASDAAVRTVLGTPTDGEIGDTALRYRSYAGGRMYWTPSAGAREVHGAILATYLDRGGHVLLGPPLTDELPAYDGFGRYNHFAGGSVYWTAGTGAHEIRGAIRSRWEALGWERSYLGYPTSDEFDVPGGRRSDFEHGFVVWDAGTGQVTDRPY